MYNVTSCFLSPVKKYYIAHFGTHKKMIRFFSSSRSWTSQLCFLQNLHILRGGDFLHLENGKKSEMHNFWKTFCHFWKETTKVDMKINEKNGETG